MICNCSSLVDNLPTRAWSFKQCLLQSKYTNYHSNMQQGETVSFWGVCSYICELSISNFCRLDPRLPSRFLCGYERHGRVTTGFCALPKSERLRKRCASRLHIGIPCDRVEDCSGSCGTGKIESAFECQP